MLQHSIFRIVQNELNMITKQTNKNDIMVYFALFRLFSTTTSLYAIVFSLNSGLMIVLSLG